MLPVCENECVRACMYPCIPPTHGRETSGCLAEQPPSFSSSSCFRLKGEARNRPRKSVRGDVYLLRRYLMFKGTKCEFVYVLVRMCVWNRRATRHAPSQLAPRHAWKQTTPGTRPGAMDISSGERERPQRWLSDSPELSPAVEEQGGTRQVQVTLQLRRWGERAYQTAEIKGKGVALSCIVDAYPAYDGH